MSVAEAAHRPAHSGRTAALIAGFALILALAVALAWFGVGSLRPQISPSGLEFRTVKGGTGERIAKNDAATLDYVLTADDGTVLDSSASHRETLPMTMGAVFPGFAEAMGKMQEGGEYRFTMPQRLAFGANPAPPGFPKDSALTFEVRVRKIIRGAAAMVQQMQAQQQMQAAQQQGQPQQP